MEMARNVLGGEHLSEVTMAHAREMLAMARLSLTSRPQQRSSVHQPPGPKCQATALQRAKRQAKSESLKCNVHGDCSRISGMSGSGKSAALHALEDRRLPLRRTTCPGTAAVQSCELQAQPSGREVAIAHGCTQRHRVRLSCLSSCIACKAGLMHTRDFLDADSSTLIRRFSETRRRHPPSPGSDGTERSGTGA